MTDNSRRTCPTSPNRCQSHGEYADLKQYGRGGGKWEVTKSDRVPKDIRNKVRSLRIVKIN